MKVGIVFGTFAPMHLGHIDVIGVAKDESDKVIVVCCGHEGDRGYPLFTLEKRNELAKTQFEDDKKLSVALLPDTDPEIKRHWNEQQIWNYWTERMLLMLFQNELVQARDELTFYTSEADYAQLLKNTGQKIRVRKCSRVRPISGTMIRENTDEYLDQIAPAYRKYLSEKRNEI